MSKLEKRSPGNLRASLFDLGDQDREAIARIRERLELNSNALAVRIAIRALARRLSEPDHLNSSKNKGQSKNNEHD